MLCHKLLDIKQFMVLVYLLYAPIITFLNIKQHLFVVESSISLSKKGILRHKDTKKVRISGV